MYKKNKDKGFTLIEVMIVVAILGIVSAIAVPSYMESVRKGKRADAKVELLRISQLQESYFTENLSYAKDLSSTRANGGLGLGATVESEQGQYNIEMETNGCDGTSANSCSSFKLIATPKGGQVSDKCGKFTLTETGFRDIEDNNSAYNKTSCWK